MAVTAEEPQLEIILSELQSALRAHTERLRRLAAAKLTTVDENVQQERRAIYTQPVHAFCSLTSTSSSSALATADSVSEFGPTAQPLAVSENL